MSSRNRVPRTISLIKEDNEDASVYKDTLPSSRYVRKMLKPIAKSVYSDKKVSRLNGSLNASIGTAGLHIGNLEQMKGQMDQKMQQSMTQTFKMSILNNSFNFENKNGFNHSTLIGTERADIRAVRSLQGESFAPFSVIPNAKIPDLSENRREEREDSLQNLLRRPKHKQFDRVTGLSQSDKLMSAPLTMEDKGQFINLPLINSLREVNKTQFDMNNTIGSPKRGEDDAEGTKDDVARALETVPNPPSFYDDDIQKWQKKFQNHINERSRVKKQQKTTQEINSLTKNVNLRVDDTTQGAKHIGQRGQSVQNPNTQVASLFEKVMQRRKSRQSNFGPGCIDIDYAGNSAQYHHLIVANADNGRADKTQLNFEMKLRSYKNTTDYLANKAWQYPVTKEFSSKKQWQEKKKDTNLLNSEFKFKFNDKFEQRNAQELLHQFDKRGINQTAQWQCQLRDLQRNPKQKVSKKEKAKKKDN